MIGAEKPAANITTADVAFLAEVIGTVPPNYAKLKSKASLVEAAAANVDGPKLEPATQEKLFRFAKAVMKWAETMELIPKQPGANVRLRGGEEAQ